MPGVFYQEGGGQRAAVTLFYQDGVTLRTITEAWYQEGGSLRKVWPTTTIQLTAHNITAINPGGIATAQMQLLSTGVAQQVRSPGGTTSFSPEWLLSGSASDYEARWTNTSGAITTGTAGVWQNLGTTRAYGVQRTGSIGTTFCSGTLEIRDVATSTVQATATIQLTAEWS